MIYVICGIVIAHDPKMCPIVFGSDVMHINEGAGLNVKIWKCSYFNNHVSVLFHIWHSNVVSLCPRADGTKILNLINMRSGRGLI